jgi:hypothetical protein
MAAPAVLQPEPTVKHRWSTRVSAVHTGIVAALLAVIAGSFLGINPPEAYGMCMACHGRDLVNWTVNMLAHMRLEIAPVSAVYPTLTTVGVLLGALLGSLTSGEFRWRTPDNPIKTFLYGIVIMNCALVAGGCSIRLLLRTSSGELLGALGFGGLILGVVSGTFWLRWRATR